MRGRCGRVIHRSGRILPCALPLPESGTTATATHRHCRGSGNGLRFSWGSFELRSFYRVSGGVSPPAVTVDPLSHAGGRDDGSGDDGTAGNPSEAILLAARLESDLHATSEGIGIHGTGSGAVLRIESEHGSFVVVWYGVTLDGAQLHQAASCASLPAVSCRLDSVRPARQNSRSSGSTAAMSPLISNASASARARQRSRSERVKVLFMRSV